MMELERPRRKKTASTYNIGQVDEVICCLCGSKCKDSVNVNERLFPNRDDLFSQALSELLEKEEWSEEVITSENRACSHCHNLVIKILQLLEEVNRHKAKLKHTFANRHIKTEAKEPVGNQQIVNKGERQNRLFDCEICNKRFTRKASMLEHAARHKGIRDRECKVHTRH